MDRAMPERVKRASTTDNFVARRPPFQPVKIPA